MKDFGTKTHFFSLFFREKVRFRAILRKLLCLFHISQIRKTLNIGGVASEAYIWFLLITNFLSLPSIFAHK